MNHTFIYNNVSKHLVCLALTAFLCLCTSETKAQIIVEADTIDCGATLYADSVSAVFKLTNNYKMPIRINKVDASCGCTTVDYPMLPIRHKKQFEITVSYDAMQLGHYLKWVDVYVENISDPIRLTVTGEIESPRQPFKGRQRFARNYDKM